MMKSIFFRGLQADPLVIPLYIVLNQLIDNTELPKSVGLLQAFVPVAGSSWVPRFWRHCLVPRSKAWLTCARWGAIKVRWFLRQALPFFLSLHWQNFVTNCPFFAHLHSLARRKVVQMTQSEDELCRKNLQNWRHSSLWSSSK